MRMLRVMLTPPRIGGGSTPPEGGVAGCDVLDVPPRGVGVSLAAGADQSCVTVRSGLGASVYSILGGQSQILHRSKSHFTPGHLPNREIYLFLATVPLHSQRCQVSDGALGKGGGEGEGGEGDELGSAWRVWRGAHGVATSLSLIHI